MKLILASTSPYRRELLCRLGLPFQVEAPEADESPLPGEEPTAMIFGGPELDELYIAESRTGAIYRMQAEYPGQRPFAGPRSI